MATYLVKRRMDLGWIAPAGGLVVDPIDAELLMQRNYIQAVADDFPGDIYDENGSRPNGKAADKGPKPAADETTSTSTSELPRVIDLSGVKTDEEKDMGDDKTEDRKAGAITEPDGSPVVDETGPNGPTAIPQDPKHYKSNDQDQAVDKKTGEVVKDGNSEPV